MVATFDADGARIRAAYILKVWSEMVEKGEMMVGSLSLFDDPSDGDKILTVHITAPTRKEVNRDAKRKQG